MNSTDYGVDFRAPNNITIKGRHLLPLIDDHFDRLEKGKYFIILDIAPGFHQIPTATGLMRKTVFDEFPFDAQNI
jgi:hypothetical protein